MSRFFSEILCSVNLMLYCMLKRHRLSLGILSGFDMWQQGSFCDKNCTVSVSPQGTRVYSIKSYITHLFLPDGGCLKSYRGAWGARILQWMQNLLGLIGLLVILMGCKLPQSKFEVLGKREWRKWGRKEVEGKRQGIKG